MELEGHDLAADSVWLDTPACRFNFGQLWHRMAFRRFSWCASSRRASRRYSSPVGRDRSGKSGAAAPTKRPGNAGPWVRLEPLAPQRGCAVT
jgi:hypothetical protein